MPIQFKGFGKSKSLTVTLTTEYSLIHVQSCLVLMEGYATDFSNRQTKTTGKYPSQSLVSQSLTFDPGPVNFG